MTVPHLRYPFELTAAGSVGVVEQDTVDEVAQCVQALLSTNEGERIEVPAYGVRSLLFSEYRRTLPDELLRKINEWEPRAATDLELTVDKLDELVLHVHATVSGGRPDDSLTSVGVMAPTSGGSGWGLTPWGVGPWGE